MPKRARARKTRSAVTGTPVKPADQSLLIFEYIKSPSFRVIHADGAIGGLTPQGNIHFALYSERTAIPRMHVFKANPDGTLGAQISEQTVTRPGIIREMDVDVVLSPQVAEGLLAWLTDRVNEAKKRGTKR